MKPRVHLLVVRVSLVLAIVGGLAVGGLNLSRIKQRIERLQANLAAQTTARERAEADLRNTRSELTQTADSLKQTKTVLEATAAQKDKAVGIAAAQTDRAEKLNTELVKTRQEREGAREELARYRAAGLEPEQAAAAAQELKRLGDALKVAEQENKVLGQKLRRLADASSGESNEVALPSELKAKVLIADPKWRFVILDAGEKNGVLERGELLVSRQGKLVAKVKVASVQQNHCVANLMPGWEFAEVMEGDLVIPAKPRS